MNSLQKQYLPGLDLLKFILAIMIVSGHCWLFEEFPTIQRWWGHFTSVAVPLFFSISSFFFFRKVYSVSEGVDTYPVLVHSIKRLIILFGCWYLLMIPMTYCRFYSVATLKETIFAILLSCCFNGYWFIKALIINTVILYFCRKTKGLIICTIFAFGIYFYCAYNYIYHYNPALESFHPYYSFYYHTISFCIGAWLVKIKEFKISNAVLFLSWILAFILCYFEWMDPLFRIVSIFLIFPIFLKFTPKGINPLQLKEMRGMSIIFYMVQFVLIWLYDGACKFCIDTDTHLFQILQFSVTRFIIVLSVAVGISLLILRNETEYKWLRYLH